MNAHILSHDTASILRIVRKGNVSILSMDIYKLPIELRRMIWRFTFPARNIEITSTQCASKSVKMMTLSGEIKIIPAYKFVSYLSDTHPPLALHLFEGRSVEILQDDFQNPNC